MSSSIALNVGGASASGAAVFCVNTSGSFAPIIGAADASGNVTFSGLVAGTYKISASTSGISSGAYKGFIYRSVLDFTVDGTTAYTGVVIPAPTAP